LSIADCRFGRGTVAETEPGESAAPPRGRERGQSGPRPQRQAQEPREGYTAVGRVLRPHALKGELRVSAFSPTARNLQRGRPVYLAGVRRIVERARLDRDAWILQLAGLTSRNDAEAFRGELLETADNDVLRDDDESYFVHELIGLRVVTDKGRELGRLTEVLDTGANDVYVVGEGRDEVLVPAIGEVVVSIDVPADVIVVRLLGGILDDTSE
jgi:16S rRNA processing protein RimM